MRELSFMDCILVTLNISAGSSICIIYWYVVTEL